MGNSEFTKFLNKEWLDYNINNARHKDKPILFWEAAKTFLRGRIIAFTAVKRKTIQTAFSQETLHLRTTQLRYQTISNRETKAQWLSAKQQFNLMRGVFFR